MASPTSLEATAEDVQQRSTGQTTPLQSLEQVQCNVLGCDEWLPRQDLPVHLAGHFSRMAEELARLRRAVEEKDEKLDDLEREKACLEEEVRLVKQEGATQIRQLEQTQRRMIGKCQNTYAQTRGDLQQTRHNLEQTQGDLRHTEQVLNQTRQWMNRFQWSVMTIVLIGALMMSQNSNNHVYPVLPVRKTMSSFQAHKEANDSWFSEPFYTHPHGYKVCLVVQAAGAGENSTGYVSVGIRLMRGEFDDNLDWPFHGNFNIQLLDDKGSYHTRVLDYPDKLGGRVATGERADHGGNITKFVSHNGLKLCLQDNSLQFRVSRFEQNHTTVILQEVATVKTKQREMFELIRGIVPVNKTMDEFRGWRESGKKWYSEPFYTHPHGYKVRLVVQAAGTGESSTGYVSVWIRLMRGEFDDNLDWPFHGNFTIQLLNKKRSSHTRVHDYPDRLGGRITAGEMANHGWGFRRFVSHSDLKSYLQENSLQFRVSRFEQYHTAVIFQEVATVKTKQQEMFELIREVVPVNKTMDVFLCWKESGEKWYSEPFYTHLHGYKVHLVVQVQGRSVYVMMQLLRGEFDANLDWPFHGNFTIQLLDKKGKTQAWPFYYQKRFGGQVSTGEMADEWCWISLFLIPDDDFYDTLHIQVTKFRAVPQFKDILPINISMNWNDFHESSVAIDWYSDSFYTHLDGYKLFLRAIVGGDCKNVPLYFYMMRGEHDDKLHWPFQGTLQIEVLTLSGEWKKKHRVPMSEDIRVGQRVTSGIGTYGRGPEHYLVHSELEAPESQFLDKNMLTLRVSLESPH